MMHLVAQFAPQLATSTSDTGSAAGICLGAAFVLLFVIARTHGRRGGW
jgi:hypothetical protein